MTVIAALCGALIVAGLGALGWGVLPRPVVERVERRPWSSWAGRVRSDQVAGALVGGVVALALTRWPVAAVAGAAGAWQAVAALRRPKDDTAERAEAVALWAEILRDGLGTSMEIETVLRTTAPIAPQLIRHDVEAATARLAYVPYDDVLDELAAKLDASSGDMVVAALRCGTSGRRAATGARRGRPHGRAHRSACCGAAARSPWRRAASAASGGRGSRRGSRSCSASGRSC
jgi:tight adherence protein B